MEPKKVIQSLEDKRWKEAMQEELLKFHFQKVWTLVNLPNGKRAIGTKWVFRNKKDKRGIVVRNKGRLVAQGYTQEEGIDYDEDFAPVARIEAIRLFLAYTSFMGFIVYQMDVKSAFLYGTIDEEMSSIGELTFFLGLQVQQKKDGIFISQDKYVANILKKFDYATMKTTSTPMEPNKVLIKDEEADSVDVHLYRSMIGSLMYLTASRPDKMFVVCACSSDYAGASLDRKSITGGCQFLGKRLISLQCKKQTIVANSTTEAEYVDAANCCGQVLWIQNQMLDYVFNFMNTKIFIDNESTICIVKNPVFHSKTKHIEIRHHFIRDCYEKKLIQIWMKGQDNPLIHNPHPYLLNSTIKKLIIIPSSCQPKKTHKHRKAIRTTEISQSNGPINLVADEIVYKEWEDRMERAATTASSLDAEQDSGNINRTQSMATLNESFPQGTNSSSGPRCQDTILGV
ncbi:putative ribonuclease H-like domain-containing protein [Tanacetum coccineum]